MVLFNYSTRELTAKIVYYGPGICGKTTNLQFIHENLPGEVRGKMLSLATKTDRTLFFDFLPIDLGEIRGMKTRVQLYTVPGQVFYNETRKLVLKGVDGIVFVADSQETMLGANVESFKNLEENLRGHGMKLAEMPHVIQFNKRDLPKLSPIEDMNASLNKYNAPFYESVATTGIGVQDTLKAIVKLVLLNLTKKYEPKSAGEPAIAAAPAPKVVSAPAVAAKSVAAVASPAMSRGAATLAVSAETVSPVGAETERMQIPLSPIETAEPARRAGAPAKLKSARKPAPPPPPPVDALTAFGEDEIDGLVGEVEDVEPLVSIPLAAAAEPAEEGAWMGLPEGHDEPGFSDQAATYGSNAALEDLLDDAKGQERAAFPVSEWKPAATAGGEFEVDRGFDPEWPQEEEAAQPPAPKPMPKAVPVPVTALPVSAPPPAPVQAPAALAVSPEPVEDLVPIVPFPIPEADSPSDEGDDVLLTEVASDSDLFSDPSLEIAQLADGEAREIVVPVMLGHGPDARRYKLAIRLRLDAVD
jgi:signal recognition particle receptor subunit beta